MQDLYTKSHEPRGEGLQQTHGRGEPFRVRGWNTRRRADGHPPQSHPQDNAFPTVSQRLFCRNWQARAELVGAAEGSSRAETMLKENGAGGLTLPTSKIHRSAVATNSVCDQHRTDTFRMESIPGGEFTVRK